MNLLFSTPISSQDDAEGFLFQMHDSGLSFHPEDNPADIINSSGKYLFDALEAELLRQRMYEVYQFLADPCEYLLSLMATATDETRSYGPNFN